MIVEQYLGEALDPSTWNRVELGPFLAAEFTPTCPTLLCTDGGGALFYAGHVCGIHADSGVGKTWIAALLCRERMSLGEHVAVIDLEEPTAHTWIERLRDLGVDDETIREQLHYYAPTEPFTDEAMSLLLADMIEHGVTVVVVDSLGEAFGLEGIDENADREVAPWLRRVARRLADTGLCVLLIDHATKAAHNPLHPSGSKRKRAAITGASYLGEATSPRTRDGGGCLVLKCAKDRHGTYRRGETVAKIEFTPYPDGGMTVHVWPVRNDGPKRADAGIRAAARSAVKAAKELGYDTSQRQLITAMQIKASRDTKIAGIEYAISDGALRTTEGARRSVLHTYVRDLRDE